MTSSLDNVYELLRLGYGDTYRLNDIKQRLANGQVLYDSDNDYLQKLVYQYRGEIQKVVEHKKPEPTVVNESEALPSKKDPNENVKGIDDANIHENNPSSSLNIQNVNSFCGKCGKDMGSDSFCSKCGQSNQSPNLTSFCGKCGNIKNQNEICQTCDGKNNSTGKKSKKVGKVILYLFGLIVMIIGLIFFGATMNMPMIFAGQYLMLSLFILVIGGIIIYAGKRIK